MTSQNCRENGTVQNMLKQRNSQVKKFGVKETGRHLHPHH